jgi:hypothetical protein
MHGKICVASRGGSLSCGRFLRLGGAGLAGMALPGGSGCGGEGSSAGDNVFAVGVDSSGTLQDPVDTFNKAAEPIHPYCEGGSQKVVSTILHEVTADVGKGDPISDWISRASRRRQVQAYGSPTRGLESAGHEGIGRFSSRLRRPFCAYVRVFRVYRWSLSPDPCGERGVFRGVLRGVLHTS